MTHFLCCMIGLGFWVWGSAAGWAGGRHAAAAQGGGEAAGGRPAQGYPPPAIPLHAALTSQQAPTRVSRLLFRAFHRLTEQWTALPVLKCSFVHPDPIWSETLWPGRIWMQAFYMKMCQFLSSCKLMRRFISSLIISVFRKEALSLVPCLWNT